MLDCLDASGSSFIKVPYDAYIKIADIVEVNLFQRKDWDLLLQAVAAKLSITNTLAGTYTHGMFYSNYITHDCNTMGIEYIVLSDAGRDMYHKLNNMIVYNQKTKYGMHCLRCNEYYEHAEVKDNFKCWGCKN